MIDDRRKFLKVTGLAGLNIAGGNILNLFSQGQPKDPNIQAYRDFFSHESIISRPVISDLKHSIIHYDSATYCGHPRMVGFHHFGGGEIVVGHFHAPSYYQVYTDVRHVAYQSRSVCLFQRSKDGGETWPKENDQIIFDRAGFVKNPDILLNTKSVEREYYDMFQPGAIFFSQNTYELEPPMTCFFLRSVDKGKTWEKQPTIIKNPFDEKLSISRHNTPIIRMPDGKTLLASFHVDAHVNTADGAKIGGETVIFSSTDQGVTWQFLSRPIVDPSGESSFGYQTLLLLPSGELQCYVLNSYRKSETVSGMRNAICMVSSNDSGVTWNQGRPISGQGIEVWQNPGKSGVIYRSPWPIHLMDGRILVLFARRRMPTGIGGIISSDGGQNWSDEFIIRDDGKVWNEDNHEEGDWGDLGYPVGCQLEDGRIFIAYYINNKDIGRHPQGGNRYIASSAFRI